MSVDTKNNASSAANDQGNTATDTGAPTQPTAQEQQQKSRFWKIGRTAAYVTGGVVVVGAVGAAIWAFTRSGKAAEVVEAAAEAAA